VEIFLDTLVPFCHCVFIESRDSGSGSRDFVFAPLHSPLNRLTGFEFARTRTPRAALAANSHASNRRANAPLRPDSASLLSAP
jgi:hypothetical protein